ncbi:MAG: hydrogenase iron-sulfur subunit [Dissulfurispiraceae bacterium]
MTDTASTGIFICTCNGLISEAVDLAILGNEAAQWRGAAFVREAAALCSPAGMSLLDAVKGIEGVDRIVIAACSPFLKNLSPVGCLTTEQVSIREQCALPHKDDLGRATAKAKALLRLSFEKVQKTVYHPAEQVPVSRSLLVVGGGVAGITAALEYAGDGRDVFLVEKSPYLGGKAAGLHRFFPFLCPPSCGFELMYASIRQNRAIHVFESTEIISVEGSPGHFTATLRLSPRYVETNSCTLCQDCLKVCPAQAIRLPDNPHYPASPVILRDICPENCRKCENACSPRAIRLDEKERMQRVTAGTVIVATGWEPFDPAPLTEYGYGRLDGVIIQMEFEHRCKGHLIPLDKHHSYAFIQCVGSRDERHLQYCSDVCCMVSIKQALFLKEANPDNEATVFYNDIRTPGGYEELYRRARKSGVRFVRGIPTSIRRDECGKLLFSAFDTAAEERRDFSVDMVVLAVGMKPATDKSLQDMLSLALNRDGFMESHLQCRPQDTRREGIFSAGCCRAPMDIARSIESSGAAAMRALRFIENAEQGKTDVPQVNTLKCDVCKRCMEECPAKAYVFDEKGFPRPDATKCRGCGVCMGSCPLAAISLGSLSIDQLSGMIDVLDKDFLGEDEPIILGFLCRNDAYHAVDDAGLRGLSYPANFLGIMVPCAGAVNGAIVAKAISSGVDGVVVAACQDEQCHYTPGSTLAKSRAGDIIDKLKAMYFEPERVRFVHISRDDAKKFAAFISIYTEELRALGRNPMRL